MSLDLSLNRVYWEYIQNRSWKRPDKYATSQVCPSIGVRCTVPQFYRRSKSFYNDLKILVEQFHKRYGDTHRYVLTLSGGIDSEVTAEMFYQLGIPFRTLSQRLLGGINDDDLSYAYAWVKERKIEHETVELNKKTFMTETIPQGVKLGQFTHSYSQIAHTNMFNYVADDEILIFSGHNPDFHPEIGIGWWEDSPNLVKYAINANKLFFTFTSLEPIFCHYAANYDATQPGDKDNSFLYEAFPHLTPRVKLTGWEHGHDYIGPITNRIRETHNYTRQSFITWDYFTAQYVRKQFYKGRVEQYEERLIRL